MKTTIDKPKVTMVINSVDVLKITFNSTRSGLKNYAREFANLSTGGAFSGCVMTIDGWLCAIRTPRKSDVDRVASFFSGHYFIMGINVQAGCDSNCRFTAMSASNPGGTSDAIAFLRWGLKPILEGLPTGYYCHGDNAYTQAVYLMTPYNRLQSAGNVERDTYNFFLSQLRIRIEMAFGLLTNKWRVFQQPLNVAFAKIPQVIHCAFRLHNWCIDYELTNNPDRIDFQYDAAEALLEIEAESSPFVEYTPTVDEVDGDERDADLYAEGRRMREAIVDRIAEIGETRPLRNLARNYQSSGQN